MPRRTFPDPARIDRFVGRLDADIATEAEVLPLVDGRGVEQVEAENDDIAGTEIGAVPLTAETVGDRQRLLVEAACEAVAIDVDAAIGGAGSGVSVAAVARGHQGQGAVLDRHIAEGDPAGQDPVGTPAHVDTVDMDGRTAIGRHRPEPFEVIRPGRHSEQPSAEGQ